MLPSDGPLEAGGLAAGVLWLGAAGPPPPVGAPRDPEIAEG